MPLSESSSSVSHCYLIEEILAHETISLSVTSVKANEETKLSSSQSNTWQVCTCLVKKSFLLKYFLHFVHCCDSDFSWKLLCLSNSLL